MSANTNDALAATAEVEDDAFYLQLVAMLQPHVTHGGPVKVTSTFRDLADNLQLILCDQLCEELLCH